MANESSRREILVASAALAGGASAALIVSCGGGDSKTESTGTVSTVQMQNDAAIAATLLDLEQSASVAYDTLAPRLAPPARRLAQTIRGQEHAHADALRDAIATLAESPPTPKPASEYRSTFPPLRAARAAPSLPPPAARAAPSSASDAETPAIAAYADALGKTATDSLRVTLAAIMATESE